MSETNLDSMLPAVRCSDELRQRIEAIAERLAISTAELIRAYVNYCSSRTPSPKSKLIVSSSRKIAQEGQNDK